MWKIFKEFSRKNKTNKYNEYITKQKQTHR